MQSLTCAQMAAFLVRAFDLLAITRRGQILYQQDVNNEEKRRTFAISEGSAGFVRTGADGRSACKFDWAGSSIGPR